MKKILLSIIFIMCVICSISAQQTKTYVTVTSIASNNSNYGYIRVDGDVPSTMKSTYTGTDFNYQTSNETFKYIVHVLNLLAKNGFVVESVSYIDLYTASYLMSKTITPASTSKADVNEDGKVTVADANEVINEYLTTKDKK